MNLFKNMFSGDENRNFLENNNSHPDQVAQAHCESARASQIMIRFKNNDSLANRTSLEEGRERKITATITT